MGLTGRTPTKVPKGRKGAETQTGEACDAAGGIEEFESAVVNASPLIYLGRTGNRRLIEGCARNVHAPDFLIEEIHAGQAE